jgi:hypothetical protein
VAVALAGLGGGGRGNRESGRSDDQKCLFHNAFLSDGASVNGA